ncbi:hypothetical protein BH23GEM6_BH23GEM6_20800 [soil metagenome]
MSRYDNSGYRRSGVRRYGSPDYGARGPAPFSGWYPGAYWAGVPMFGWAGAGDWGWPAQVPVGYGAYPEPPRRSPRESGTYGRGGDEAARRWAERYGYDIEYSIQPRQRGNRSGGYDRDRQRGRQAGW